MHKLSLKLSEKQEILLADKLFDLANYFAVGFIFSQFTGTQFDLRLLFFGSLLYLVFAIIAVRLRR